MPFKSKAQQGKMFAMEAKGELKKGTAERWAKHTPNIKGLPKKVRNPVQSPAMVGCGESAMSTFYDKRKK